MPGKSVIPKDHLLDLVSIYKRCFPSIPVNLFTNFLKKEKLEIDKRTATIVKFYSSSVIITFDEVLNILQRKLPAQLYSNELLHMVCIS